MMYVGVCRHVLAGKCCGARLNKFPDSGLGTGVRSSGELNNAFDARDYGYY